MREMAKAVQKKSRNREKPEIRKLEKEGNNENLN